MSKTSGTDSPPRRPPPPPTSYTSTLPPPVPKKTRSRSNALKASAQPNPTTSPVTAQQIKSLSTPSLVAPEKPKNGQASKDRVAGINNRPLLPKIQPLQIQSPSLIKVFKSTEKLALDTRKSAHENASKRPAAVKSKSGGSSCSSLSSSDDPQSSLEYSESNVANKYRFVYLHSAWFIRVTSYKGH